MLLYLAFLFSSGFTLTTFDLGNFIETQNGLNNAPHLQYDLIDQMIAEINDTKIEDQPFSEGWCHPYGHFGNIKQSVKLASISFEYLNGQIRTSFEAHITVHGSAYIRYCGKFSL